MKTQRPTLSRRHLLLAAGAATAAAISTTTRKDGGEAESTQSRAESHKGYHVTEHVRNYYRTARI